MSIDKLELGTAVLRIRYDSKFDGIYSSLHGGILMTLADTAACAAVMTHVGLQETIATTDMNIRFLAPCRSDCLAAARVIKSGRTLVPVEVELRTDGKLAAVAQVTYIRIQT